MQFGYKQNLFKYFQGHLGGAHPKKNQKKPSQFTNFGVATGFFLVFFGFFWFFFGFFLVFFGFFWDDIPTIKSNAKKKPKNPKKKPKKTKKTQKPVSNFECWPKLKPKKPKKPKKTKKNQFPISNSGQNQCQKNQKKPKKTNANLEILKNQKKPMPICQFWCSDWFFLGEHPPPPPSFSLFPVLKVYRSSEPCTLLQYLDVELMLKVTAAIVIKRKMEHRNHDGDWDPFLSP